MAQKPTTTRNLDSDVARELEQALDLDLTGNEGDLDIAASMEDLEAQIAQAADELARESGKAKPTTVRSQPQPAPAPKPVAAAPRPAPKPANEWRQTPAPAVAEQPPLQPTAPTAANTNDDRQRDIRAFRRAINQRASNGIYWLVMLLSVIWVSGGAVLARLLKGPDFWRITSF
jgi:hypothetical protein